MDHMGHDAAKFGEELGKTISTAALFGRSWKDALGAIAIQLTELVLKMTLFKSATASSGGGFFTSLLSGLSSGGFKAEGGPVDADHYYVVGERGPEVFAPGVSGAIIPNHALTSGGQDKRPIQFIQHVHGVSDVDSFKKSQTQIAADMAAMVGAAHRRVR